MKRVKPISFASTASFGAYLHWTSHYLQSPLSAMHGYLEMLAEPAFSKQAPELLENARQCSERAQRVLQSISALHKLVDSHNTTLQRADLGRLLKHIASQPQACFELQRQRSTPYVLAVPESLEVGLMMLCVQFRGQDGTQSCTMALRQRADEVILHLHAPKLNQQLSEEFGALTRVPLSRYPLPPGELIPLATALVVLRRAGARVVARPTRVGSLDAYIHLPLVRQLALLDLKPS